MTIDDLGRHQPILSAGIQVKFERNFQFFLIISYFEIEYNELKFIFDQLSEKEMCACEVHEPCPNKICTNSHRYVSCDLLFVKIGVLN